MKKLIFSLVVAIIATVTFNSEAVTKPKAKAPAAKVVAVVPATTKADWFVYEAMWVAGGQTYQDAVYRLAGVYAAKMDKHCKAAMVNITDAVNAYRVATPSGAEAVRDSFITKQIATLACISQHGERYATVERLM